MLPVAQPSPEGEILEAPELYDITIERNCLSTGQVRNGSVYGFRVDCNLGAVELEGEEKAGAEREAQSIQVHDEGGYFGVDEKRGHDGDESCRRLNPDGGVEGAEVDRGDVATPEPEFGNPAAQIEMAKLERNKITPEEEYELIDLKARLRAILASSKTAAQSELAELKKESTALVARINKIKKKMDAMLVNLPIPYEKERRSPRERKPFGQLSRAEQKRKRDEAKEDWRLDTEVLPGTRAAKMKKLTDVELTLQDAGLVLDEEVKEDFGIFSEVKEKKRIRLGGSGRARKGDLFRSEGETLWETWAKQKPFHAFNIQ